MDGIMYLVLHFTNLTWQDEQREGPEVKEFLWYLGKEAEA